MRTKHIIHKHKLLIVAVIIAALLIATIAGVLLVQRKNEISKGRHTHTITIQDSERTYTVYVPDMLSSEPAPLVVMLHGALGTGDQAEEAYGWDAKAAEGKFIVAYPTGLNRSWAVSENCCGPSVKNGINDVTFITEMVDKIKADYPIDDRRIYATGISNGGALAYRLACDTNTFTAIGVVAGNLLGSCPSPSQISVMHIHGMADQTFPYGGGAGRRNNDGQGDRPADTRGPSITSLIDMWRKIDNCQEPTITVNGPVTTASSVCEEGKGVELITIEGAGHQWPGSKASPRATQRLNLDPPSTAMNATDALWAFFSGHAKM